ncbi:MBL fold metallo-hydrolase [Kibdelosporangium aridum]|uniref:Metallo-beta-lactamase superfamily protein n=1 Tax=Kibdelosporangium aridum TaxID=2030 RepID=A0A1W1ZTP0_KIBAR|nr:MBL fold metallo-hydrolase [Kibdelosporangium aridum]SMC51855.1 Metallo-beta-lactamase superfamily protein [Kibdelosporangium aridum]
MTIWICGTCAVEHPDIPRPPASCEICLDERQYVPQDGQIWTTLEDLNATPHTVLHHEPEPGIHQLNRDPGFGIGQWSYLVQTPQGNLLWDPPNHLDPATAETIEQLGGIAVIVASHPHMFGSQVSWSHRFGKVPVLVHAADRHWVRREDDVIREWNDTEQILPGITLITAGGHFPGSAVAHIDSGALLAGDTIVPAAATGWVSFMRSYPNKIPLSAGLVQRIADRLEPYDFDRLYWLAGPQRVENAKAAVKRSAQRYISWVSGENDHLG